MTLLMWDKPKRIMSKEAWKDISADGAPPGVYTPNMSDEDQATWKAKLVGIKSDNPMIEIRKTCCGTQVLIVVCLDEFPDQWSRYKGKNVKISQNGPAYWSSKEINTLGVVIHEAWTVLLKLDGMKAAGKKVTNYKQVLDYINGRS